MVAASFPSRLSSSEQGAETVQLAFSIPILLVLIVSVVQLCIMAFFTLCLSGATEQAAWLADTELLSAQSGTSEANEHVKKMIAGNFAQIDSDRLRVTNAKFAASSPYSYKWSSRVTSNKTLYSSDRKARYDVSQLCREVTAGLVEFDVNYDLPSIISLPGLSGVTISRHVARERVISTRTEIR